MNTNNPTLVTPKTLNPWFSIWIKPRQTIRQVQQTYSVKKILWLLLLSYILLGFLPLAYKLNSCTDFPIVASWWIGAALMLIVGAPCMLALYWLWLWTQKVVAHWMGSYVQTRDLVYTTWVYIASIWFMFPLELLLNGTETLNMLYPSLITANVRMAGAILYFVASCWMAIIGFLSMSEILGFSKRRTLGYLCLYSLVGTICIILLVALGIAVRSFAQAI